MEPHEDAPDVPEKSFGNMSEHHWSKTRGERNRESIDYYRERSKAPGVAEGGADRNFYCMECDGVVPYEHEGDSCPHCDAPLGERVRRYFNWVEIDRPAEGDFRAILPWLLAALALLVLVLWLLTSWLTN